MIFLFTFIIINMINKRCCFLVIRVGIRIVGMKLFINKLSTYCEVAVWHTDFIKSIFMSPATTHGNDWLDILSRQFSSLFLNSITINIFIKFRRGPLKGRQIQVEYIKSAIFVTLRVSQMFPPRK